MKKTCLKCKNIKESSYFNTNNNRKDKLQQYCKLCISDYRKNKNKDLTYRNERLLKKKIYRDSNSDKIQTSNQLYNKNNRKKKRELAIVYRKNNIAKMNALAMKRHANKIQRTLKWLTKEQLFEIEQYYALAKELQWLSDPTDPLEVDHIIPLQGKDVSGLHVPWNLQILPKSLNLSKGNRIK